MNPISARFNRSLSIPDPVYWWGIVVVFLLAGVVTIAAPAEQTLGSGIRPVYVHVGLTWTGTAVFLLAAVLGVLVLHPQNPIGTSSSTGIRSTFLCCLPCFLWRR